MSCSAQSNLDLWQQVLGQDARFSHVRPLLCDNQSMRSLYLRRRHQLFKENAQTFLPSEEHVPDLTVSTREQYKCLRESILIRLYGACSALRLSTSSSNKTRFNNDGSTHCASANASVADSSSQSVDQMSCRSLDRSASTSESLTDGYAFSGIECILDHHTKAVNRLRFANNDNTRLAIASADGTISVCSGWPQLECEKQIVYLTGGHRFGSSVTDVLWSLSNDFLVSTSVDGSVCVWDAVKGSLTRQYSAHSLALGPALVCTFQPQNYNLLVVGGGCGIIQTINLSTGKSVKKGRDQLHFLGLKHPSHRRLTDSVCPLEFTCTGYGAVTALTFEQATGTCLWAGTDRGIIQSYLCEPSNGHLIRTHRINLSSDCDPASGEVSLSDRPIALSSAGRTSAASRKPTVASIRRKLLNLHSKDKQSRCYPSVTSLSFHSWLSRENGNAYLLGNAAGLGLLLFQVDLSNGGRLTLKRRFPIPHCPLDLLVTDRRLHLIHSCLAPLLSMRSGACAITGSEDSNVYLFDVLFQGNPVVALTDPTTDNVYPNRLRPGLVTILQGHTAPVLDVSIGWDESVLASGDANGLVIIWRRVQRKRDN